MRDALAVVVAAEEDSRQLHAAWLELARFHVVSGACAAEALARLPDPALVALVDASPPDAVGATTASELRAHQLAAAAWIIVLTHEDRSDAHARAVEAGADVVLEKPVALRDLAAELAATAAGRAPRPPATLTPWRPRARTVGWRLGDGRVAARPR